MSRTYGEYCPECKGDHARKGFIKNKPENRGEDGYYDLLQCNKCGACFLIETAYTLLETNGIEENEWGKAWDEAMKSISKRGKP